MICNNLKLPA